jgi:hypothetical protein
MRLGLGSLAVEHIDNDLIDSFNIGIFIAFNYSYIISQDGGELKI